MTIPSAYRKDIDGLRAVAVSAVFLYHIGRNLAPGGFLGVDVFFVISGYLITALLLKDMEAGQFSMIEFWERRARRILPPLLVVMFFTLIAGWFILFPKDYLLLGQQLMAQAIFSSNILFAFQSDYFDSDSLFKPLLHTWSLAVEEQFYIVFPILLAAMTAWSGRKKLACLLVALAACYALSAWSTDRFPQESFYLLAAHAWELLLGGVIVFVPKDGVSRWEREAFAFLGLVLILQMIFAFDPARTHASWRAALQPCIGAALVIASGKGGRTFIHAALSFPPLVWIGLLSYSIYLWHWPVLIFARYVTIEALTLLSMAAVVASVLALSFLSWRFVEIPVRRKSIFPERGHLFLAMFSALLLLAAAGGGMVGMQGISSRFPSSVTRYAAGADDRNPRAEECFNQASIASEKKGLCRLGTSAKPPLFIAFGDSTADALMPGLDATAARHGISGLAASYDSCPPVFGTRRNNMTVHRNCGPFNEMILRAVRKNHIRHVILVGRWSFYSSGQWMMVDGETPPETFAESRPVFHRSLIRMVQDMKKEGISVWIVKSAPEYGFDIPRRLAQMEVLRTEIKSFAPLAVRAESGTLATTFQAAGSAGARFIDPASFLCTGNGLCRIAEGGDSLYRDSHHLSTAGALHIQEIFDPAFVEIKAAGAPSF